LREVVPNLSGYGDGQPHHTLGIELYYPPIYPQAIGLLVLLSVITGIFTVTLLLMLLRKQRKLAKPTFEPPNLRGE
jgi:hypothetical protein